MFLESLTIPLTLISYVHTFLFTISLETERSKKGGSPGIRTRELSHHRHCPPRARHSDVAAWAAILCPYEAPFYDVIGISAFSWLLRVAFGWVRAK